MRKKLLAVAIAGLAATPVLAQTSNVTISGRINSTFERIKATGATSGTGYTATDFVSRNRITENSSEIRVSGREQLDKDLTAWFTIGTGLDIAFDTGFSRGLIGSRNSGVGLESKQLGSIMLGKWDVHYEAGYVPALGHIDFGYIDQGLATFASLVFGAGQPGVGNQGGRLNNVVRYVTPQWNVGGGHLQVIAAYARNDETVYNENGTAAPNGSRKPYQFQLAPHYHVGPFSFFYSYYQDKEGMTSTTAAVNGAGALLGGTGPGGPTAATVGLANGLRDMRGDRLGVSWKFDNGLKVGVVYDRFKSEIYNGVLTSGGAFSADLKRDTWAIPVSYVTGPHKLNFVYARASNLKGSRSGLATDYDGSDTGASYFTLGYRYALSKRTSLYADWAKISNKSRAGYDFFAYAGASTPQNGISSGGPANLPGNSIGADPQTFQVGIYHLF
ncbi:MAG: porin [Pseudomonadota bacterium]